MKKTTRLFIALFFSMNSLFGNEACAEIVVVVHPDNPIASLSREQLVDIYTGRQITFPCGNFVLPFDLPPDTTLRKQFYKQLVGKSVAQVNAYWARLLFTGRATPPRVLPSAATTLKMVEENSGAIAYIDNKDLTSLVKVVFHLRPEQP